MSYVAELKNTVLLDKRGLKKIKYFNTSINPTNEVIP